MDEPMTAADIDATKFGSESLKFKSPLEAWEENWQTEMGAWFPGEKTLLRGKNIFTDLYNTPWMAMYVFAITGWLPNKKQLQLLEGIWSLNTSYPDPRIWNNRIASLAATARSTYALGLSAATAVSEAIIYGLRPIMAICHLLVNTNKGLLAGEDLEAIIIKRLQQQSDGKPGAGKDRQMAKLPGFGRPLTNGDERLQPVYNLAAKLGFGDGEYLKLVYQIETTLQSMGKDWRMNAAAQVCALLLDQGMTPRQAYQFLSPSFSAGVAACYVDAENHAEGSFLPIRCDRILYQGPPLRKW